MNIQYSINNNDIITEVNTDFIEFGKENAQGKFVPETWIGVDLFTSMVDFHSRFLHQLMLQRVRVRRKTLRYRYRCDSPNIARFMIMNIIPEGRNAVKYENIVEDVVLMPNVFQFQFLSGSEVKRCSFCNSMYVNGNWYDPVHFNGKRAVNLVHYVEYTVCDTCFKRLE